MQKDLFTFVKSSSSFNAFTREFNSNSLSQVYLVISTDEIYRNEFIKNCIKLLFCTSQNKPCNNCVSCKKIDNNNNVDVLYFGSKTSFLKENSLKFIEEAYIKPFENDRKVLVIPYADQMSEICQNLLLKTLENLPPYIIVFFVANNSDAILQTIQSRCRKIILSNFSDDEVLNFLGTMPNAKKIMHCSDGQLGKALEKKNDTNFVKFYDFCVDLIQKFTSSKQMAEKNVFLNKYKNDLNQILDIFQFVCYRAIKEEIVCDANKNALIELILTTNKLYNYLNSLVITSAVIDKFLLNILEVKQQWK